MNTHLYVVHFSDDRIKVGITSDVTRRMSCYRQEAARHDINAVVWWASAPFATKDAALLAERILCRTYSDFRLPRHREWIRGNPQGFAGVIKTAEKLRELIGDESEEEKIDLPYLGLTGSYIGLARNA